MCSLECAPESILPKRLASFQLTLASVVKPLVNCEEIWWVVGANLGTHVANNLLVIFLLKHLSLEISLEAGRKWVGGANLGTPLILTLKTLL